MTRNLLIVDDEPDMLHLLKRSLEPDLKCRVFTAESGKEALEVLGKQEIDLVLADIKMPGMDGLALLEHIHRDHSDVTVVMMTAYGCIDNAVESMKHGAYDFITKPFDHEALLVRLEKALERSRLIQENIRLRKECGMSQRFEELVGMSPAMKRVFETIRSVAQTDLTVLITGESGTGKDLTARAIHRLSDRSPNSFVAVNCPSVPEQILESELFGYKKGAFTHAVSNKHGLFQEADKGTIFLDEIGDISPAIQTKLLRVLQEKEIKPLGDTRTVKVDVRIITSTNQDLRGKIRKGEFREDFFYRLNVLPIHLPPLRERREDIPMIVNHLVQKHSQKLNKPIKNISPELMESFIKQHWEGNVREMENIIIRGILFSKTDEIRPEDIGLNFRPSTENCISCPISENLENIAYKSAKEEALKCFNERYIGKLLSENDGNVTQAAKVCGLERQALQQIMRRYGIKGETFRKG